MLQGHVLLAGKVQSQIDVQSSGRQSGVEAPGKTRNRKQGEIEHRRIDNNGLGAFRIGDQVWLNVNGCVHKIDVKIDDDDEEGSDVNLDAWKSLPIPKVRVWSWLIMTQPNLHEHSNSVMLTFERKKVDIC